MICTVIVSVAFESVWNTTTRTALELVGSASWLGTILCPFIGIVEAVIIAITNPSFGDATLVLARKIPRVCTGWD